jgi:hypothetical protein
MLGVGSFGRRESPNPILGSHCRSGRRWGVKPELGCRGGSCSTADVRRCGVLGALAAATAAPSWICRILPLLGVGGILVVSQWWRCILSVIDRKTWQRPHRRRDICLVVAVAILRGCCCSACDGVNSSTGVQGPFVQ